MHEIGRYHRVLPVSLERMFENAMDWEHLPHLHRGSFAALELLDESPEHWTARVVLQPAALGLRQVVRLRLDRDAGVWVTEVLGGVSKGVQIHTQATALGARSIAVDVRFLVPRAGVINRALAPLYRVLYRATYRKLYDEDERMMVERQHQLDRRRESVNAEQTRRLGARAELLAPGFSFAFGTGRFRVTELEDGSLLAFSTLCPHLLGPLDDAPVRDGAVTCPWHGYCFDVRTRESKGRRLRLPPAPRLEPRADGVWVVPRAQARRGSAQ